MNHSDSAKEKTLKRELGIWGATMLGLGSMVGTGVFVSIGIAAGITGVSVIVAIAIAALVAACNALSSAQLAANHAVSGGTYEYGYRYLTPTLGFTAGWLFLVAKSASAATAALGFAAYLLTILGKDLSVMPPVAVGTVAVFTLLVLAGMKRSSAVNMIIVSITIIALGAFVGLGLPAAIESGNWSLRTVLPTSSPNGISAFFYATAIMFVAYTGYGRIATLGEEVIEPRRTIPRAIIVTMAITALGYILVAVVAVGTIGPAGFQTSYGATVTPLEQAASVFSGEALGLVVAIGATTAMLGVLLNLILGLSRVALAMGRQGDLPPIFAQITANGNAPSAAIIGVGVAVGGLALFGSIETTWAFSAFTVLLYYALTNLAALRLPKKDRLYPAWISVIGLVACLFLAFWVPVKVWVAGLALIGVGLIWRIIAQNIWGNRSTRI